jgi:hypothetical protein
VASSGIASIILKGGHTSHSMFSIPIDIREDSMCHIKKGSEKAELMKQVKLIIWDEVPMQSHLLCEAVDRTMRDLLGKDDVLFGGIPIAWGGDFQQTLPVIPCASTEQIIGAYLPKSDLWKRHVQVHFLKKNMQADQDDPDSLQFSQWLLDVGY